MKEKINHSIMKFLFIILLIMFSFLFYARFISTSGLKVKEYKIINNSLPQNFSGFKIVHLSDIHYGSTITDKKLDTILERINLIKPDLVVITGDLIDKDLKLTNDNINSISSFLKNINSSVGKYIIRGNHDYHFAQWNEIVTNGEFINLDNNFDYIYKEGLNPMLITGLSSMKDEQDILLRYQQLQDKINKDKIETIYNILLIHETDFVDNIDINKYNLILGGHSHNGQVRLPFIGAIIKPKESNKYYDEYYKLNNTDFYISSGLGTSELDLRFFNKPSFNLYRLTNQ